MAFLQNESRVSTLRQKATGGSQTAANLAADTGYSEGLDKVREGIHLAHQVAHGNIAGAMMTALRHLGKINPEKRSAVLDEVRKTLLDPDPNVVRTLRGRLADLGAGKATRDELAATVQRYRNSSTTLAARVAGAAEANPQDDRRRAVPVRPPMGLLPAPQR